MVWTSNWSLVSHTLSDVVKLRGITIQGQQLFSKGRKCPILMFLGSSRLLELNAYGVLGPLRFDIQGKDFGKGFAKTKAPSPLNSKPASGTEGCRGLCFSVCQAVRRSSDFMVNFTMTGVLLGKGSI